MVKRILGLLRFLWGQNSWQKVSVAVHKLKSCIGKKTSGSWFHHLKLLHTKKQTNKYNIKSKDSVFISKRILQIALTSLKKRNDNCPYYQRSKNQFSQQLTCAEHDGMVSVRSACLHVCPGSWEWAQLLCADPTVRCPGTGGSWRCSSLELPPAPSPLRWGRKDVPPWSLAESGVQDGSLSWKDTDNKSSTEACATSSLAGV